MARTWAECTHDGTNSGIPTLSCIEILYENILPVIASFILLAMFIMFVYGGFTYLTSGGEPERVTKAQNILKWTIIGFILYISSFLILKIIDYLFLGNTGEIFKLNLSVSP